MPRNPDTVETVIILVALLLSIATPMVIWFYNIHV